jgi:predicted alpha/beta hydrolase family esterase
MTAPPILIIPGLFDSGPDHWQSHWERTIPGAERVEQTDWERPTLGDWTASLMEAVRRKPGAVLVAHSLGCALVAHLASIRGDRGIAGAFLVAPADVNRQGPAGRLLEGFSPIPRPRLPFPSMVVASRDDPYVEIDRARAFAQGWGSTFIDLGRAGHINVASGHGPWPKGRALLRDLMVQAKAASGI